MIRRQTRQRRIIREVLASAERPLGARDVLSRARRQLPYIGIATVYRNINLLLDEGFLQTVEIPAEPARYERAELPHHHHFYCKDCGNVYDIDACPGSFQRELPDGFQAQYHDLTIYGTCAECFR